MEEIIMNPIDMDKKKLIINKTKIEAFDFFNEIYSIRAISICPLLKKFQISVLNHHDSLYFEEVDTIENDVFAFFLNKEEYDASSTYAEILVNLDKCNKLCLTDQEVLAALAHEIGHIIMFFREDKENFIGLALEASCDQYACKMGLAVPLSSLLDKLARFGEYPEELKQQMVSRRLFLLPYII